MILFGAGRLGRRILAECRAHDIHVEAFSDNNPKLWWTKIDGLTVHPPSALPSHLRVVTITNGGEARRQLKAMGLRAQSCSAFILAHGLSMEEFGFAPPSFYNSNLYSIKHLSSHLADELSRFLLHEQIEFRIGSISETSPPSPISEIYFPPLLTPLIGEVYFDCGAYDGDTIRQFQQWNPLYKQIYAFEPVQRVSATIDVQILPCGVGNHPTRANFTREGAGSHADDNGSVTAPIIPLDSLAFAHPTLIKMDIEGAEPEALDGAKTIIRDLAPALSICLYHRPEHLWEIPIQIESLNPSYRLFIRRYAEDASELVCYAIPEDRLNR